jgi:putative endonuclease
LSDFFFKNSPKAGYILLFSGLMGVEGRIQKTEVRIDFWNLEIGLEFGIWSWFGIWDLYFGIFDVMAEHNELGKQGEEIAVNYLLKQGYIILDKNWRAGRNEIDIVARDGIFLVIAEVKARKDSKFLEPEEAVTRYKQLALIRAANAYIYKHNISLETRFDIISVVHNEHETRINHIKDAFYPRLRSS